MPSLREPSSTVRYSSAEHHHKRYGRSFVGKALIDTFGKTDKNGNIIKINLFGHSFGGATTRLFTHILANGAPEEVAAGGDVSEFFKGGKGDYVNSVISIAAPHNGTVSGNVGIAVYHGEYIAAMIANAAGMAGSNYLDLKTNQFGLTRAPGEGKASFNLCGILNYALSNDNCLYDLTLHGACRARVKIGAAEQYSPLHASFAPLRRTADSRTRPMCSADSGQAATILSRNQRLTASSSRAIGSETTAQCPSRAHSIPRARSTTLSLTTRAHMSAACGMSILLWRTRAQRLARLSHRYIDLYMNQIDIVNA